MTADCVPLEDRPYPRRIVGGDAFLDYWGPQRPAALGHAAGVVEVLEAAIAAGATGMDVSLNAHVLAAFERVRARHPGFAGILNPTWRLDLRLGDALLADLRGRLNATLAAALGEEARAARQENPAAWSEWMAGWDTARPLDDAQLASIRLDADRLAERLAPFRGRLDFCIVGGDVADWCVPLGREDLVVALVEIVREAGFVPVSLTHWPSLVLDFWQGSSVGMHWVLGSLDRQLLTHDAWRAALDRCTDPRTAFRVLGFGRHAGRLDEALRFVRAEVRPEAVVLGVRTPRQATESFEVLASVLGVPSG